MENSEWRLKSAIISLSPEAGPLGYNNAKHLLNRCLFGARHSEIQFIQEKTAEEAVNYLLQDPLDLLAPPLGVKDSDEEIPVGETWVNTKYNSKYRSQRLYSYNNWWVGRLVQQDLSLKEKMVLFWHNHFVIENDVIRNTNYNYQYNILLYSQCLGNFKSLTEEMTINTGMLNYLNGVDNDAGSPNENYARELFELFTIGKGPLIEEGNYTYYTEHDIREAAKVLTGWKINNTTEQSYFNSNKHDKTEKIFSEIFEHHSISNKGENEYKDLIDMIFARRQTARHLVRKLYRWFIYYRIDEEIEAGIIEPLTTLFIENNFEVKPLLKTSLSSKHFFDATLKGCMIRNPLEFNIGLLRQLEFETPDSADLIAQYGFWNAIRYQTTLQDMDLGNPPDVAGWPAWYLAPLFNEIWINSATIPNRANVISQIILRGIRPASGLDKIYYDPFKLAYQVSDPSDINELIATYTGLLFAQSVSQEKINGLKEVLNPGLPDFEWKIEWNKYVNNPEDENQKNAIKNRLNNLLVVMCSMAEYQLI